MMFYIRYMSVGRHLKLTIKQSPRKKKTKIEEDKDMMAKVSFAHIIGSLMYDMVCTRSDITHPMRVVSRFLKFF